MLVLEVFVHSLPVMACFFGVLVILSKAELRENLRLFTLLLSVVGMYCLCNVNYLISDVNYESLVLSDSIGNFMLALLPTIIYTYAHALANTRYHILPVCISLFAGLTLATMVLTCYIIMRLGPASAFLRLRDLCGGAIPSGYNDELYAVYRFVVLLIQVLTLSLLALVGTGICYWLHSRRFAWRHLREYLRGDHSHHNEVIEALIVVGIGMSMVRIGLGRLFFVHHLLPSIIFSVLYAAWTFTLIFFNVRETYRQILFGPHTAPFSAERTSGQSGQSRWTNTTEATPKASSSSPITEVTTPAPEATTGTESALMLLQQRFEREVIATKAYLSPSFHMNGLVKELGTNRTYISMMVNHCYNMSFRELLGTLRIEHAMKLLQQQPDKSMVNVAEQCGFSDGAQFAKKFKSITGDTPSAWLRKQGLSEG